MIVGIPTISTASAATADARNNCFGFRQLGDPEVLDIVAQNLQQNARNAAVTITCLNVFVYAILLIALLPMLVLKWMERGTPD